MSSFCIKIPVPRRNFFSCSQLRPFFEVPLSSPVDDKHAVNRFSNMDTVRFLPSWKPTLADRLPWFPTSSLRKQSSFSKAITWGVPHPAELRLQSPLPTSIVPLIWSPRFSPSQSPCAIIFSFTRRCPQSALPFPLLLKALPFRARVSIRFFVLVVAPLPFHFWTVLICP